MSTEHIRSIGRRAAMCLTTPGSLGHDVGSLATETANTIDGSARFA